MHRELQQELVQVSALLGIERREERVLHTLRDRAELGELLLARRLQRHDMPPAVGGVALPFDQAQLLELVEQAHEPAPVVAE